MTPVKQFTVFGEPLEVLIPGELTGGPSATITQSSSPRQTALGRRGSVHIFRNVGSTTGKVLIFITPAGLERYLEEISPLSMPGDMAQILAISERYSNTFVQ